MLGMDMNGTLGLAPGTYGLTDLPLGLGFGLAMNETALEAYAALSEQQKEQLIMRCRDAKSKEQMQSIIDSLAPGADAAGIAQEQKAILG